MFTKPEEIEFALLIGTLILGTFVIFIVAIFYLFKKRQNALMLEKQLERKEHENTLLKKELEIIKAIKEERERIGDDLHDDLGSRLSAIRLKLEFLQKNFTDDEVKQKMSGVVSQSRELSSIIREVVWTLNAQYDTLDSFIIYTKDYVHSFLSATDIELQTEVIESAPKIEMSHTIRRALFLTIKEALNNAVKHSGATKIFFRLNLTPEKLLKISIEDNGSGIQGENQFGNGLQSIKKRIDSIGGEFEIENRKRQWVKIGFKASL